MAWPSHVIFHVPHASRVVPPADRKHIILTDLELQVELDRLTDHNADTLIVPKGMDANTVTAHVSRLVVDVERFLDDTLEPMARVGMGAIYTHTSDGRPLKRPMTDAERRRTLEAHYHPHHARLTAAVDRALATNGHALILDLHTFPDPSLPCDHDQRPDRPDICLGTDSLHTPIDLVEAFRKRFVGAGFSVEIDRPYTGSIVPMKHYGSDLRVSTVMIEVNRRLYLQSEQAVLRDDAGHVGAVVQDCLSSAIADWTPRSRTRTTAR